VTLKAQALKSLKWTTTSAIACSVLQVARMAILARLIAREDFGLFATIAVILGFADFFVEAGLGSAIIHKQDATEEDLASAYTINILLGWLVFAALYLLSSPIAGFYNDSRLIGLLHLATLVFLFQPLGRQYDALLRRDLKLDTLAKLEMFAAFIGFASSLCFAFYGLAVRALIYSQLLTTLIHVMLLLRIGIRTYGFRIGFSYRRARFFLRFGVFQICENAVNYLNTQLDSILIGKLLGQEALGVFYMAKQLAFRPLQIINPILTRISFPVFAKVQNDTTRLKRGFLQVVHSLALIQFALFTLIAAFSDVIVSIFLGNNWSEAAHLLKILAFYTMLRSIGNPVGSLLLAKGRVDVGLYWNIGMLFYTPPIVIFASKWGATGIAWGLLFAMIGSLVPGWYFLVRKLCGASFSEYFSGLTKTALLVTICFGPSFLLANPGARLTTAAIGFCCYLWYNHPTIKRLLKT